MQNSRYDRKKEKVRKVAIELSDGLGKLPPQAVDLEEAVLGAIMLERDAFVQVADIIREDDFYIAVNQEIFSCILNLFRANHPIDMRTVVSELRKCGKLELVGGAHHIAELTSRVTSAANIEYHVRIICEMSIKRKMILQASEVQTKCYDDTTDVFELIDGFQGQLDHISNSYFRTSYSDVPRLYRQTLGKLLNERGTSGITGVPSGYTALDRITGGWQSGDLIIIAARPSMGKSVVAIEMAKKASLNFKVPIAVFSLEMPSDQIINRMIASESEIDLDKIVKRNYSDYELQQIGERSSRLDSAPIFIDDTPALSILELRAKCRRLKHEKDIKGVVVDYLQLMKGDSGGNREQEIASISRGLKIMAKELAIPVIALSQLSRGVETRGGDKRPMLSDLRESGAIEQDADVVCFLYRPEYYGITVDEDGFSTHGLLEVIVSKNRNGKTGSVKLKFEGKYARISDFDQPAPLDKLPPGPNFKQIESNYVLRDPSSTEVDNTNDMPF